MTGAVRTLRSVRLDREQQRVARIFAQELRRSGASPRVQKALFAAGLVESGLRPLSYGDRDSLGPLQQRPSQGWGSPEQVRDPRYAARQFLKRAIPLNDGFKGSAGQLAQAVQRSAFPGRYDERGGQADALRRQFLDGGSGGSGGGGGASGGRTPGTAVPGAVDSAALIARMTEGAMQVPSAPVSAPSAPSFAARAVAPAGAQLPVSSSAPSRGPRIEDLLAAVQSSSGQPAAPDMGGSSGGQAAPRSSRAPGKLLELFHDPGVNIDEGRRTDAIGGHGKHVHVALSDSRALAHAKRIARQMGLTITSERGGKHTPGSFHYQGKAIDVGGDPKKLLAYNRRIARLYG